MMHTDPRGTGRTYRQLEALPDGGVFVVHTNAMRHHVRRTLNAQGRKSDAVSVRVVTGSMDTDLLRGLSVPLAVDHAVWDAVSPETCDELRFVLDRNLAHA